MKNFSITLAILVLFSYSCNNSTKKTDTTSTIVEKTQTSKSPEEVPQRTFTPQDYTLFLAAALENRMDVVYEKIEQGIDVNHLDENNRTALMLAAFNGNSKIIKLLLENGADVKLIDVSNRTALMFACTGPFPEAVKLLINAGSDVNGIDGEEHWTPLMFAAGEGQLEIVEILIEAGANITSVDVDGETAYDFASSRGHNATATYIKELVQ